ncbi:MAG: AEC family transporter [Deferrisomatales bacterium]|nr:AEC family transporter [Deferrisomatales bacterium]
MDATLKILPVFLVILAGIGGKRLGLLPDTFQGPANRLVYYVAIPCLLFLKVEQAPFREILRPGWIAAACGATVVLWSSSILLSGRLGLARDSRGSFVQCSIHANLGYIGLAAAFYGLGERGFQAASVFAPFFMLTNNGLSVLAMGRFGSSGARSAGQLLRVLLLHPVILASFAGLFWSWTGWGVHPVAAEALGILAGMALPLALLLIGAGLRLDSLERIRAAAWITATKTLALPALGALLLTWAGADGVDRAAAVLLLSAPSATISLIMAREMGGDPELASTAVTVSTLASAATLTLWLGLLA